MLPYDDILNLNFYMKTSFTGWMGGMRFLIKREVPSVKKGEEVNESGEIIPIMENLPPIFHVWVWPGPYIFDLTEESKKTDATFDFSEDGRKQVVDWINLQYESRLQEWPKRKTDSI